MSPSAGFPVRRPIPALLGLLLLAACGGGGGDTVAPPPPPPPAPVSTVALSATAATLVPQQTTQLSATPKDASGNALAGRAVTWSSSASIVASVNAGLVTAVAPGSATITATSEGKSADAVITVQDGGVASVAGGTITAASGNVSVTLPAQALAAPLALTVTPLATTPGAAGLVAGTAYDFGPNGTQFAQPVTLKIRYDPAQVSPTADPTLFRLHLLNGAVWEPVPGSSVDVATHTVTGTTTHFSGYAISQIQAPVASVVLSPAGAFNLALNSTQQLAATPKDAAGNALSNRVVTWSSSATGIATVSSTGLVTAVAVGSATISATSEGVSGQVLVTVTAAPAFVLTQVSAGYHSCGLTAAGAAWCWGRNEDGEVGDGTKTDRSHPVQVSGAHVFSQIVVGLYYTCAITPAGATWCWGINEEGELGNGTFSTTDQTQPVQVQGAPAFVSITAGSLHTCGLTAAGKAWCWGANPWGVLGDGTQVGRNQPVQVFDPIAGLSFVKLSAGQDRTCGVTPAAQLWCWGSNGGAINSAFPSDQAGILGVGILGTPITTPMQVVGPPVQWADVSAGYRFACGRTPAPVGALWCWGANTYIATRGGMIGDGSLFARLTPVLTATGSVTFMSASAGFFHACGLSAVGEAWCWGTNFYGEVGDGLAGTDFASNISHPTPIKVVGGHSFNFLSAGKLNTCGITTAGETWCWGYNAFGELGDGTTTNRTSPVKVSP